MHEPTPKMKRSYRNPPVEEALVEFRFVPGPGWDPTLPGKLHQHAAIKNGYAGKPRTQKIVEAALEAGRDQPSQMTLREGFGRVQLVNENGNRLISLGPDVLSVNVLRPYEGWTRFRQRIDTALQAYAEVAEPGGVSRVGVRYINKIVLPEQAVELKTWFRCGPPAVPELPGNMAGFMSRVEFLYPDAVKLLLTQASIDAPEEPAAFLLDLDVLWESGEARSPDAIMTVVDDLHARVGGAFEAIITDATRERFDAS
ncbi:MAG: TIGR04255 family protein [Candidatus Competibacteraceae bacterium]|nr:MAG: TIGR04255 family protein [Candidatus Competibacteraceae bacterium]